ncbi:pib2p [Saccharomyces arboricola H-6]|uniref:Pib2p n=1 Tax=Saccharomyces arboricola (strain H-6 / AS 2.3317 / CBS 10644) TaxID=1160507 RepID=J8Q253_SACAR|nr:pib2p [Saccharomyces arboricola H-6]
MTALHSVAKTPAIKEEEEDGEERDGGGVPPGPRNHDYSGRDRDGDGDGDGEGRANTVTPPITFEKQKVVPRTSMHSVQSILSSISLKSMVNQHRQQQQQQQEGSTGAGAMNGSATQSHSHSGFVDRKQQIQSPAMVSILRKNSAEENARFSHSNKVGDGLVDGRKPSNGKEIGKMLPFMDNQKSKPELNAASIAADATTKSNYRKNVNNKSKSKAGFSELENDADEDDAVRQKNLTTQALRKLSSFKMNASSNLRLSSENKMKESSSSSMSSLSSSSVCKPENVVDKLTTTNSASMTQLRFGNTNVIIDSVNHATAAKPPHQQMLKKPSLDFLPQPSSSVNLNFNANKHKTSVRQINNPKKPLYIPAVLRKVSETNITNDDLLNATLSSYYKKASSLENNFNPNSAQAASAQNANNLRIISSQSSVQSNTSSILESYRNKISSYLFPNSIPNNDRINLIPTISNRNSPRVNPPTKDHWIPDSKRNSCRYCHKLFTLWERKHHCRHCGDIFCQDHLRHWLYLDSQANFIMINELNNGGVNGGGTLCKICDDCLAEYENLSTSTHNPNTNENNHGNEDDNDENDNDKKKKLRNYYKNRQMNTLFKPKKGDSPQDHAGDDQGTMTPIQVRANDEDTENENTTEEQEEGNDVLGSVIGSVPANWNWSSF